MVANASSSNPTLFQSYCIFNLMMIPYLKVVMTTVTSLWRKFLSQRFMFCRKFYILVIECTLCYYLDTYWDEAKLINKFGDTRVLSSWQWRGASLEIQLITKLRSIVSCLYHPSSCCAILFFINADISEQSGSP